MMDLAIHLILPGTVGRESVRHFLLHGTSSNLRLGSALERF